MISKTRGTDKAAWMPAMLSAFASLWLMGCLSDPAAAQAGSLPPARETLDVGAEPGRISTEEAVISDGP